MILNHKAGVRYPLAIHLVSSVEERLGHIENVSGSNPLPGTMNDFIFYD